MGPGLQLEARKTVAMVFFSGIVQVFASPTSSICFDSPLPVSRFGIGCETLAENLEYCIVEGASSHCPLTCDECEEFGCEDSSLTWTLMNGDYTCAMLASKDPETIENFCGIYPELGETCRLTCGICGE